MYTRVAVSLAVGGPRICSSPAPLCRVFTPPMCPIIAERLHYPLINVGSTNPDYPKRCDGINVLIGGTKIKTINAKMDRKKNGNIPAKIPSKVMSLPSGI